MNTFTSTTNTIKKSLLFVLILTAFILVSQLFFTNQVEAQTWGSSVYWGNSCEHMPGCIAGGCIIPYVITEESGACAPAGSTHMWKDRGSGFDDSTHCGGVGDYYDIYRQTCEAVPTYTLTAQSTGDTTVAMTGGSGANSGTTQYQTTGLSGSASPTVTAPATADNGNAFCSWGGCSSTGGAGNRTCTRSMSNSDRTVTANYGATIYTLTINATGGDTTVAMVGTNGATSGTTGYTVNSLSGCAGPNVTAPATSDNGSTFSGWTGCSTTINSGRTCIRGMGNADRTITANYTAPTTRTLTINSLGASGVSINGTYNVTTPTSPISGITDGASVNLTAPDTVGAGSPPRTFLGWTGCNSTSGSVGTMGFARTCNVTMSSNKTVTANYSPSYNLSSDDGSVVTNTRTDGQTIRMTWTSTGATSCTADTNSYGFSTSGNTNSNDWTTALSSADSPIVFRMRCTGAGGTGPWDTRTITVNPVPNTPPTADAGSNRSITEPTSSVGASSASGSDTDGSITNISWSKVGGPAGGGITNGTTYNPTFNSLVVGTYTFQLTVTDDDGATGTDTMTVTVSPAGNAAPTADAGSNRSITEPTSSVGASGASGSDTDGSITSISWSKVGGPAGGSITNPTTYTPTFTALVVGTYTFQLTVTDDDGATGTDIMTVTVSPAGTYNLTVTSSGAAGVTIQNSLGPDVTTPHTFNNIPDSTNVTLTTQVQAANGNYFTYGWTGQPCASGSISGPLNTTCGPIVMDQDRTIDVNYAPSLSDCSAPWVAGNVYSYNAGASWDDGSYNWGRNECEIECELNGVDFCGYSYGNNGLPPADEDYEEETTCEFYVAPTGFTQVEAPNSSPPMHNGGDVPDTRDVVACTPIAGPPLPTAVFTAPDPATNPHTINSGDDVLLEYETTNADDCTIEELNGGVPTGTTWTFSPGSGGAPVAGSELLVNRTLDREYSISCTNTAGISPNSPDVVVTINAGACTPEIDVLTIRTGSCTILAGDAATCSTMCDANAAASCSGGYTINNATVFQDCGAGAVRCSCDFTCDTCGNTAPTANAGPDANITLPDDDTTAAGTASDADGDPLTYSWSKVSGPAGETISGGNTLTPTFDTLSAGTYVFRLTVDDGTDSTTDDMTVTVNAQPNLTIGFVEDATYPSLTPEVDGLGNITGNYTDATVRVIVSETAGVAITDTFAVEIELDLNDDGTPDVTYVVPGGIAGIAASGAIPLNYTFSTIIPIAPQSRITARVDTPLASNGVIGETNEADNTDDLFPLPLGLPPIDMELILDPSDLVRGGGNVDIDYDVNATFSMSCELYGPGLTTHTFDPSTDGPSGSLTAGPISSKSVYVLSCTELVTGANQVFTESASVETTGTVEEI